MHIFQVTNLLYLSLHATAGVFLMISILGIPGNPDENKPLNVVLMKLWSVLLIIAWKGIPVLVVASLLAFGLAYDAIGKVLSCISLGLGLSLFSTVLFYYLSNK